MPNDPHGGHLVDRILKDSDTRPDMGGWPAIELSSVALSDLENIALGVLSPLTGFMGEHEARSVLERGRLPGGLSWTIPILLDVTPAEAATLAPGAPARLTRDGQTVGMIEVGELFSLEHPYVAQHLFGTTSARHPGVAALERRSGRYVAGPIRAFSVRDLALRLSPAETRAAFARKGWRTVAAFQTRNVPHIGHEFLQRTAMQFVDGLYINPALGKKKRGDFLDEVIVQAYRIFVRDYYPEHSVLLGSLGYEMRYAGPKEAVHHAIMRKNLGCTHFIVGRDHAGVGDFYDPFAAHRIFDDHPDLGIEPMRLGSFVYCRRCGSAVAAKTCPHGSDQVPFSATALRALLTGQGDPAMIESLIRPEVLAGLRTRRSLFHEVGPSDDA